MARDLLEMLLAAETEVWRALERGDATADEAALSPDFVGVYPTGITDRADHVDQLVDGPSVTWFRLDEVRAIAVGDDHGLLVYRADYRRPGSDVEASMYVSSLWRREDDDRWTNVFSQDTPVGDTLVP